MTVEELIELNPYLADNPDLIYAGEELNIDRGRIGRDTSGMRGKRLRKQNQIIYSGSTGLVDGSISNTTVWVNMNQVNGVEKRKKDGGKIYIVERVDKGEEMMGNMAVYKNENKEIGAEVISEYSTGVIDKELMERYIGKTNWIGGEGIRREWSTNDRWEIKEAYLTYDEVGTMREGIELLMGAVSGIITKGRGIETPLPDYSEIGPFTKMVLRTFPRSKYYQEVWTPANFDKNPFRKKFMNLKLTNEYLERSKMIRWPAEW